MPETTNPIPQPPAREARLLLRAARAATLATTTDGQPFASLVTPTTAPDASILVLLSDLSEHTRHLRADPRCAIMVMGQPDGPNPQTAPRLTITGLAALEPGESLKSRWIALHPYAAFYAGFGDFNLWRIRPIGALFVGGFARAHRLRQPDLVAHAPAIAEAEPGIIAHCNDDHPDALALIATAHGHNPPGTHWTMATVDADGFDLVHDETVRRIPWPEPAATPNDVRKMLVDLARAARNPANSTAGREETPGL